MAEHITLDTLMQSSGHTALQVQEPASVEAVRAQVEELSPEQKARVEEVKNSIDLMDSQTALQYGIGAQRNISSFSDNILTQVRSKDSGYVGELMSDLVLKVKEVDVDGLDEGFWDKIPFLKNASRAVKKFMQRYEKLEVQIDRIEQQLDQARMQMLKDITMFDGLYEKNLEYLKAHAFIDFSTLWHQERYVVFAVLDVSLDVGDDRFVEYFAHPTFKSDEEFERYIRRVELASLYAIPMDVKPTDALLTLSTCLDEDRLVILARRQREGEKTASLREIVNMAVRQ